MKFSLHIKENLSCETFYFFDIGTTKKIIQVLKKTKIIHFEAIITWRYFTV